MLSRAPETEAQDAAAECSLAYLGQLTEAALAALGYSTDEAATIAEVRCASLQPETPSLRSRNSRLHCFARCAAMLYSRRTASG